jgi:hypothetical protein
MTSFRLSPEITLPANAATSTYAFLGTRGTGKTYAAGVFAEELLDASVQVVIVDPVGPWYALRLDKNGRKRGIDIPVFGGIHGDVPLEHTAGALVARLIVERGISVVLDISDFTDGQQHRFVTDLCREVFQLKKRNKSPLHFIFDEGHEFFPQFVDASLAQMVGATKRLWKVGRNYGIGGTIISPRAAEVNKGALNLTDEIYTGKLKAPEDIKRINGWANANGVSDDMIARLPDLPKGRLIAWRESGAVETRFREKRTFDASATPDGKETKPRELEPLDLDEIRKAMASVVEESKANDPRALRARIAELERELAKKPTAKVETVPVPAITEADHKRLAAAADKLYDAEQEFLHRLREADQGLRSDIDVLAQRQQVVTSEVGNFLTMVKRAGVPRNPAVNGAHPPPRVVPTPIASDHALTKCARAILTALAQLGGTTTDSRVSAVSGYRVTSSGFANALSELRTAGLMTGSRGHLQLTDEGARQAGSVPPLPTGKELLDYWLHNGGLGACERALLDCVYANNTISRAALATASGYSATSSGFANAVSKLRTLDLVHGPNGGDLTIAEAFQ